MDQYCTTQNLKNSSREAYEGMAKNIINFMGNLALKDVKPSHLSEFVTSRGDTVSASTVRSYRLLRMCMADAELTGLLERTPFARHRAPKYPRSEESRFLTSEEVRLLLAAADGSRLQRPLAFMLATGVRSSELFALRKSDLHLEADVPYVTIRHNVRTSNGTPEWGDAKTVNGLRSIDLSPTTVDVIKAHLGTLMLEQMKSYRWDDESLLFPSTVGSVWDYKNFRKLWDRIVKDSGIAHASPHSTRHTHASHSIAAGEQVFYLSRRLGHSAVSQTYDTYGHLLKGGQEISAHAMDEFLQAV